MSLVNQSTASAGQNVVGRDDNSRHYHIGHRAPSVVEELLIRLHGEIDGNATCASVIDRLQRFHRQRARDGVVGLKQKLQHSGRSSEYLDAIEAKEMFAKVLDRWSLYESAQRIFVHLMARAEVNFRTVVLPQVGTLQTHEINALMLSRIVDPVVEDCGSTVLELDHITALGMVYWLAEQCYIRWHP